MWNNSGSCLSCRSKRKMKSRVCWCVCGEREGSLCWPVRGVFDSMTSNLRRKVTKQYLEEVNLIIFVNLKQKAQKWMGFWTIIHRLLWFYGLVFIYDALYHNFYKKSLPAQKTNNFRLKKLISTLNS